MFKKIKELLAEFDAGEFNEEVLSFELAAYRYWSMANN
jgi:hypothetical protein